MPRLARLLALLCFMVAACGGGESAGPSPLPPGQPPGPPPPPPPPAPVPTTLIIAAGDNQEAAPSAPVAVAPAVQVRDHNGQPFAGAAVVFVVDSGGGSVRGATTTTGPDGLARVEAWTLGHLPGRNRLRATSGTLSPVTFTATGRLAVPTAIVNGKVQLPAGAQILLQDLRVVTSLAEAPVDAGGNFTMMVLPDGLHLAGVRTPAGAVVLTGWLDHQHTTISARTTAETFAYFDLGSYTVVEFAARSATRVYLAGRNDLGGLEAAIAAAFAADPANVTLETAAVQQARLALLGTILGSAPRAPARSVIVEPTGPRGGVQVDQAGFNAVTIRNTYRRRLYAFLDRVSFVPEGGTVPVPSPAPGGAIRVSAVTGATSLVGTALDIAVGKLAYSPVIVGPLSTPLFPTDATRTAYRITVVGPGTLNPAAVLSADQQRHLAEATMETVFIDILLPWLKTILKVDKEATYDGAVADRLWKDLDKFLSNLPTSALEKAAAGDIKGFLVEALEFILRHSDLQDVLLDTVLGVLGDDSGEANRALTKGRAKSMLKAVSLADAVLAAGDALVVTAHALASHSAEQWDVTVSGSKVSLIPGRAAISDRAIQPLEAKVLDAGDGPSPTFVYRWSTTGTVGKLCASQPRGCHTDPFSTVSPLVSYAPEPGMEGSDAVRVEVMMTVEGREQVLGEATAMIDVSRGEVLLSPRVISIKAGESVTHTASITPELNDGGTLSYYWATTGQFGTLERGLNGFETHVKQMTYTARSNAQGNDVVTVEVFSSKDGTKRSLGKGRADVNVGKALYQVTIEPRSQSVDAGSSAELTARLTPEYEGRGLFYRWSSAQSRGNLFPASGSLSGFGTATYHATGPSGAESVKVEVFDEANEFIGTATASVTVKPRKSFIQGSWGIETQTQPSGRVCSGAYMYVPKVQDAALYELYAHGFNDPFFWGTEIRRSFSGPQSDGGGAATPIEDLGGQFRIGLSGFCGGASGAAQAQALLQSRFAGMVVDVTITHK